MRASRFGQILLATGAIIGIAAVVGVVTGFEPAKLPAALLNIAAYKLTFAAAGGLLAAGAIVQRYGRRDDRRQPSSDNATITEGQPGGMLGEGGADANLTRHTDERTKVKTRERP